MRAPGQIKSWDSTTHTKGDCAPADTFVPGTVFTETISGVNNNNWKLIVAKGGNASSAYNFRTVRDFKPLQGRIVQKLRCPLPVFHDFIDTNTFQQGPTLFFDVGVPSDLTVRDIALSILKRKLSNDLRMYNASVPLGELREFHRLIKGMADLSTGFVRRYGRIQDLKKAAKDLYHYASDAWLTYSFGIKPMINDAQNLAEAIAAYQYGRDFFQRYTGTFGSSWTSTANTYPGTPSTGAGATIKWRLEHKLSYKFIAGVQANMYSSNDYTLFSHLGLDNLGSLPIVGWELLPYSWVFDYFTNVSSYLDDVWTRKPYTTRYVVECKRYEVKVSGDYFAGAPTNGTYVNIQQPSWLALNFTRTPLSSLPSRSLRFKTGYEIGTNAVNKLLNLTSVLGVRTRSRTR